MRSIGVVLIGLALALAGCKKQDGAPAGDDSKGSAKAAKPAPSPAAASSKLGERAGGDFAKIDLTAHKEKAPTFADKIDLGDLEKPVENKVPLMSFSAGGDDSVKPAPTPGFKVVYNPSKNPTHEAFRQAFQKNRVFEEVAEALNKTIRLPSAVDINTVDCNTINAFYDPNNKRIIVCYELVSYFLGVFKPVAKTDTELGNAVLGALIFSFCHESGHGLIHILDLPAVGREEDSVDQLATLILIAGGDEGVQMAMSGAHWFQIQQKNSGDKKLPFWDEHAFDGQRFYNIMCLIYGSNPDKYGSFVSSGNLPKDRAVRCKEEHGKITKAWEKLLQPHLTNGAALNINYKPHVPVEEAPRRTTEDAWDEDNKNDKKDKEPAKPAPDEPKTRAITCETVAHKAAKLIAEEAARRAKDMSDEEVDELKRKLEHELPAVIEQLIAQCAKENWSDESRKCVIDAKTLDQATKCK
jgi:hypothetical protein